MTPVLQHNEARAAWFVQARFGLFVHWGLYALAARHEWVMQREKITAADYRARYLPRFDPDRFDPVSWATAAKSAGMKYAVITAKHHEGFCLWDTALSDFKATRSPAGRDLLREIVDAFRAQGMRIGIYYSLIDWQHPDFVIDDQHPLREHPDRARLSIGQEQSRYAVYMHGQIRELLTGYGKIDLLFFYFSYPARFKWTGPSGRSFEGYKDRHSWDAERLAMLCRTLQPEILINDRLDLEDVEGGWDFKTPEQFVPQMGVTVAGAPVVWEACHTLSGSWGYARDEHTWKSPDQLIKLLVDSVSKGGNLLMNVGPTARGTFDQRAQAALAAYANWMEAHAHSIHGCGATPVGIPPPPSGTRFTYARETNRLFLHVFDWPVEHLHLPAFAGKVAYAQFVHDASEIVFRDTAAAGNEHGALKDTASAGLVTLTLPVQKPGVVIPVIELILC